ncbi:hypothetical protein DSO57_1002611 [Entomophthora muscae]|uniref:Uncharacterized protein n=1 Tax=Entomophthora muscae TaxID=34485 RepID=A0ACC2U7G7_9FUNG|nr:hypothetical protein DSO57_1002611 [Entomophthora muscae]
MEPPPVLKPSCPPTDNVPLKALINQLMEIMYIILTRLMDIMIPTTGSWSMLGQSLSYLFKLVPILWWSLPSRPQSSAAPESNGPVHMTWYPDKGFVHVDNVFFGNFPLETESLS